MARAAAIGLLLTIAVVLMGASPTAQAQTYTPLHSFNGMDENGLYAGLTMDAAGNLYGTTCYGGMNHSGTVFRLVPKNGSWVFSILYNFAGNSANDGACPSAKVIFGRDGALYGTTNAGGGTQGCSNYYYGGCGTVFKLAPPPTLCRAISCFWVETVLYRFQGGTDGQQPTSEVTFDRSGTLYGTTYYGGGNYNNCTYGCGTVYKLSPSNGGWKESILYRFAEGDGALPYAGVILDSSGSLYGTTTSGGTNDGGTVFQLTPSGSGWTETVLLDLFFVQDTVGRNPFAGLIFDGSGNLYGATGMTHRDGGGGGAVFELMPSSNGPWMHTVLYSFDGPGACGLPSGPLEALFMDAAGNLYGTTYCDGAYHYGSVFKLSPSDHGWVYTDLHDFSFSGGDGAYPISNVVLDKNDNLYGTSQGGNPGCNSGCGVVWKITP